ncbi:RNA-directed DNA polymerase from mobile element jockey [Plakobranchus ocellatus]|uniref:RNA-directed DNA polymerase from mobile element jockey n=1 Tax=Plakobranchus ocellatus TaxID=259542 RepID=A0AAV4APA3_9GAST|nr:RNA-directed DNA polymerase from mobile element jockey [Plakobranchus ocellatus]
MYRREAVHGRHPVLVASYAWVDSIPDSTWEEKEVEDSRRRSRRDDSAGKDVGIEDKSQVEKEMSPCPEREAVQRRQPALVASYDPRQPRRGCYDIYRDLINRHFLLSKAKDVLTTQTSSKLDKFSVVLQTYSISFSHLFSDVD